MSKCFLESSGILASIWQNVWFSRNVANRIEDGFLDSRSRNGCSEQYYNENRNFTIICVVTLSMTHWICSWIFWSSDLASKRFISINKCCITHRGWFLGLGILEWLLWAVFNYKNRNFHNLRRDDLWRFVDDSLNVLESWHPNVLFQ